MPLFWLGFFGSVALAAWSYLLTLRGAFWWVRSQMPRRTLNNLQAQGCAEARTARIAAVVPARDEALIIAQTTTSLAECEDFVAHIFLVDDKSSDATGDIACKAAAFAHAASRLTVIAGRELPPGWSGKLWAVYQGIEKARATNPDYFLLTDADVAHNAGDLADLIAIAESGDFDLASLMVKLHCKSVPERLLIPAFVFFFFMLYPPGWIMDRKRRMAGAAGGCMLIRPEALTRAGGIQGIRHEVIDDCALARAVKQSGGRVWLGLAPNSASIRPYTSFGEIGQMISRTAFNQLRHSAVLLLFVLATMTVLFVLPIGILFSPSAPLVATGIATLTLMTITYLPMVRYYRLNPLWALTLPAAAVFYAGATLLSASRYWSGRGGEWKGRVQDEKNRQS
ncbi:MAG: glycosyltransferase [Terriglobales bacterium]